MKKASMFSWDNNKHLFLSLPLDKERDRSPFLGIVQYSNFWLISRIGCIQWHVNILRNKMYVNPDKNQTQTKFHSLCVFTFVFSLSRNKPLVGWFFVCVNNRCAETIHYMSVNWLSIDASEGICSIFFPIAHTM